MQSIEEHGLIIIRLFTGEDILSSLKQVCRKHEVVTALVFSAIGQIKHFTLGYFNGKEYLLTDYSNTHELLSLSGMISWSKEENDYKYHFHALVGDEQKQVFGGHLSKGVAQATNEIVLLKTGIQVQRRLDETTGLQGLFLE